MKRMNSEYWMKSRHAAAAYHKQEANKYPRSDMVQEMELEKARVDAIRQSVRDVPRDVVELMRRGGTQ